MNPYHPDEPEHAAWERVRTLRVAPGVTDNDLRDLIDEVAYIFREDFKPIIAAATDRADRTAKRLKELDSKIEAMHDAVSNLENALLDAGNIMEALANDE